MGKTAIFKLGILFLLHILYFHAWKIRTFGALIKKHSIVSWSDFTALQANNMRHSNFTRICQIFDISDRHLWRFARISCDMEQTVLAVTKNRIRKIRLVC